MAKGKKPKNRAAKMERVLPSEKQTVKSVKAVTTKKAAGKMERRKRTTIMFDKEQMLKLVRHFAGGKISVSDYIEQAVNEKIKRDKGIKGNVIE